MSEQTVENTLSDKIIRQIEFYFGDVNLSKDKFLKEEITKDSGWVELETLIRFNRLKQLSTDFDVIISALKASESGLLEIDEVNKKVRRAKSLPENLSEFEANIKENTVYVKGFPSTLTLDELYAFFEGHGKVVQIFMRRMPNTRQFKGSVFVTFDTKEEVNKFMEAAEIKYNEEVLIRETQENYLIRKAPELEKIKAQKAKKEQQKEEKEKQKAEAEEAFLKQQKVLGAILNIKGLNAEATRENIKELFDNYATVRYIDYNKGLVEAFVRFAEENKAQEALTKATEAASGELTLRGAKLEARVLEGEEEEEYWRQIVRKLAESRGKHKNQGRGGGRRGNNGAYNKNKRSRDGEDGEGTSNKKAKADDDNDNDE